MTLDYNIEAIEQSGLVNPEILEMLLKEWHRTHIYDPASLGELLMEVVKRDQQPRLLVPNREEMEAPNDTSTPVTEFIRHQTQRPF